MVQKFRCIWIAATIILFVGSAFAQSTSVNPANPNSKITLHFGPAATKIDWTVKAALHTVHGTFALKDGLVTLDQKTGIAEGEITVETASGESGNDGRDRRMQKDVLESARYPEIIFHPQKVTGVVHAGQMQTIDVAGMFTIHGADHPLTLHVETTLTGNRLIAKTIFEVPYVAWGMKDPSLLVLRVSKDVKINVDAQAVLK